MVIDGIMVFIQSLLLLPNVIAHQVLMFWWLFMLLFRQKLMLINIQRLINNIMYNSIKSERINHFVSSVFEPCTSK